MKYCTTGFMTDTQQDYNDAYEDGFRAAKSMENWKIERIDEKRIKITHLGAGIILSDINIDKRMTFMYDYFSQLLEENKK